MVFTFFRFIYLLPVIGTLLVLPGCKQPTYKPKSIQQISLANSSSQTQQDITIKCKLLTKQETHVLFDGRGSRLLNKRKPIYPLFLSIENNTQKPLLLDPRNIALKLIHPELVAQRLYAHTSRRIIAPLIIGTLGAGITFIAAAYISLIGAIGAMPALIKSGYAGLGISAILAGGTPYVCYQQGNQASQLNTVIYQDVLDKSLHTPAIIEPRTTLQTLLFVPHKCYFSTFNVRLIDPSTAQSLPYDIAVEEGERLCKK